MSIIELSKKCIDNFEWSEQQSATKIGETEIQKRNRCACTNFLKFVGFVVFVQLVA